MMVVFIYRVMKRWKLETAKSNSEFICRFSSIIQLRRRKRKNVFSFFVGGGSPAKGL